MSLFYSAHDVFIDYLIFSSVQHIVKIGEFFHQFSFELIKTFLHRASF